MSLELRKYGRVFTMRFSDDNILWNVTRSNAKEGKKTMEQNF